MAQGQGTDPSVDRALTALVALLAADRDDRVIEGRTPERSKYVLEDAGLTYQEIATLTGKKTENVRGTLRRRKRS